ncbi:MAG: hypothetical protein M0D57_07350 [Sphingobacteriales bacterium JAD_PAG50586_3]|nr:MAG: hypothetical protein M0D57_07350 [Sphingobacteriales bacterium JAD_PAG50586_3]
MDYTLEEIYLLIGKDDKVASIWFKQDTHSYNEYGRFITAIINYTQKQREELDILVNEKPFSKTGIIKVKYLGLDMAKEKVANLVTDGIESSDISKIEYSERLISNKFHSIQKREITKINVPFTSLPKGQDANWQYGFYKMLVTDNVGLCPEERYSYLASKYYFEKENLTDAEKGEVYTQNGLNENVEWKLLKLKRHRKDITDDENQRLLKLYVLHKKKVREKLDKCLKEAGSSLNTLIKTNNELAKTMLFKGLFYQQRRFNAIGLIPIYLDLDRYLHIYTRHVEEMKFNSQFKSKDNFQWEEPDVLIVIGKVIEELDDEIQQYFKINLGKRYSRYGDQSYYFEGDYYTFHIEPNGLISTFHKNKKTHERIV